VTVRQVALVTLVAFVVGVTWAGACAADVSSALVPASDSASRAPSSPPLTPSDGDAGEATGGEQGAGATPQAEADPLVSNGLGSPSCKGALAGELSATGRRNCETSGFASAPAPTGDYGIDVHIDDGLLNPGSWGSTIAQDLFVTPLWMALVWAVHALVVMLEWSFTIDLLDSRAAGGVGKGLRQMQASFTEPWLPLVLAVASSLALYHGLIRRRVAQTLGEALLMAAMMIAGLWVVTDPTGTVGALGQWANQASLGTLAVAAQGTPSAPGRALASSLETVFVAAIEVPWCYLEFGDVGWCREPSQLDPQLRAAALKIAAQELARRSCEPSWTVLIPCAKATSAQASALEHSSELLHAAQSNGALFLALPANGPARNSINEQGSLLRTLCQSSEATSCRGPTAAQAQFRTGSGTLWRIGGVLVIAAGLLGLLLVLGFMAVRLLTSAVSSLLYLLLAPAMVLAPAFGEGGRTLFRKWAARLLGAVVSKLVFSFLLGIVLAIIAILSSLEALGWWTQWLLMSAFWWTAYAHRNQIVGVTEGALTNQSSTREQAQRRSLAGRVRGTVESNQLLAAARRAKDRRARPGPEVQRRQKLALLGRERAQAGTDEQARRTLAGEQRDASARTAAAAEINGRLSSKRAQLERLRRERGIALAGGDTRRAAELRQRGKRVQGEIAHEQVALNRARQLASDGERARRREGGEAYSRERIEQQRRFLDAQAALPSAARVHRGEERRDYPALSALAGYQREEYERLDPRGQRVARLEIDRELALRKELTATAKSFAGPEVPRVGRRERGATDRSFDGALGQRMRDAGHTLPASRRAGSPFEDWRRDGSSVMRDAREVAAQRKRQLGSDRP
jgi:hypothetical protein